MKIEGNTFIVTGGSSGLGAGVAEWLVKLGARVVIADINVDAGEKLVATLGAAARFVSTDVTQDGSTKACVDFACREFCTVHGLVQCAGVVWGERTLGKTGPVPLDGFSRVVQINLVGTYNMLRWAADAMSRNAPDENGERGVIINTASVAAFDGQIGQAAYSASKGGVVSMTLPLAREFARLGIRVLAIAPGIFDTPLLASLPDPLRQSLAQQVPFPPRLGRPVEFAMLVQSMLENTMLNGEVVRLDGALRMAAK